MCLEDIRLGRKIQYSQTIINVGAASIRIVEDDPKRVSLSIYPNRVQTYTLSTSEPVVYDSGIPLGPSFHPIHLNIKDDGQAVIKAWFAIALNAGQAGFVTVQEGRLLVE